ncbi:ubiquitin-associated/TS-N domain-containing protein [Forsythia ovata]|uniref:Ubiquitin-associated/TS-N domain-containing protein n=1 Tax=Forsythia ovata TaxID=205694 RepID=A0ABD1P8M6_9LAMI
METETVVIKVKYGDTLRRFNAPVVNQEFDLNMDGLREKILSLFNFAPDAELTLTYIDEDSDVVTLVDDEDLRDVVRQALNPLRITVKLNAEKSSRAYARSSGSSTPLRSPGVQPPFQNLKSNVSEILKSVPEPLCETLTKLSTELESKAPRIAELVDGFSKMGLSCISQFSESPISGSTTSATKTTDADCSNVAHVTSKDFPTISEEPSLRSNKDLPKLKTELIQKRAKAILVRDSPKEVNKSGVPHLGPKPPIVGGSIKYPDSMKWCSPGDGIKNVLNSGIGKSGDSHLDPSFIVECPFAGVPVRNDFDMPPQSGSHGFPFKRSSNQSDCTAGIFHRGIRCDGCGVHPITGIRFKSKVKEDYDLCSICFAEMGNDTDYIIIDRPVAYRHSFSFKGHRHSHERPPTIPQIYKVGAPFKLDSRFIQDVNILDGTVMAPLTPFAKIWRMRNSGTLVWPQKTKLVWIGGDRLSDASSVELEIPAAGLAVDRELDVAVDFVAPELPGRYISYWRMASPSGQKFGQRVWALIQVDTSPTEPLHEIVSSLNLNLPPVSNGPTGPEIINVDAEPVVDKRHEPDNSSMTAESGQRLVEEQPNSEQDVKFPINNSLLVGGGESSSVPLAPLSSGLHPIIDLSEVEPALARPTPFVPSAASTAVVNAQGVMEKNEVEEKLLRELEDMGFKQVDLNKEVLRTNEYDLEQSVDDLCGVSEWDPMLEELQEMGFRDTEMNKKLLKKNNGSIKRVVMDLITGGR